MTESWQAEEEDGPGSFPSVLGTPLGAAALAGMVVSALGQLLSTALGTLASMLALGGASYLALSYGGGGTTTVQEATFTVIAAAVVFLSSLIPLASGLSAAYVALRLWRGGRRLSVIVASMVSMAGPLFAVAILSLSVAVDPVYGAVATVVGIGGSVLCMATGSLAVVAVSRSQHDVVS